MELKYIQQKVRENTLNYSKNYNIPLDENFLAIKLHEEVGEFSEALLNKQRKCRPEKLLNEEEAKTALGEEIADIIGMALVNAQIHNLDVESILQTKRFDRENNHL